MKKTFLILLISTLFFGSAFAQKFAYIDSQYILKNLDEFATAQKQLDELSVQLSSILDWVEQLNEINTDNVKPLNNVSNSCLPLRKDLEKPLTNSDQVLSNAPKRVENYYVVPKVVE